MTKAASKPFRPMLSVEGAAEVDAAVANDNHLIPFPVMAEVKYDGFRVTIVDGVPMSRTLKPIPNHYVQKVFASCWNTFDCLNGDMSQHPLNGLDGELIALDTETYEILNLHQTQSRLNSFAGSPRFVFFVFDDTTPSVAAKPFIERRKNLESRLEQIRSDVSQATLETNAERIEKGIPDHVFQISKGRICHAIDELIEFEGWQLDAGHEGIMLKHLKKPYKNGRATLKGFESVKVKRFTDDEATIIGFTELMINGNEATLDERGYTKRSSEADGLVPGGTLGNIICNWWNPETKKYVEFELGTFKGWTDTDKQEIWDNRDNYIGMKINFKYKGIGPNNRPLIPSGQGVRYDV